MERVGLGKIGVFMYAREWNDSVMPLNEAFGVLQQVLQEHKAFSAETAINQAMLGKYLKAKDERFRQEIPGLITTLVQSAKNAGLVTLEKHVRGPNHNIYLSAKVKEKPKKLRRKLRSGDFIELFKVHNMGPFATNRNDLFQKVVDKLNNGEIAFAKLLSSAVTDLRIESNDKNQSWRSMHVFLENLARRNQLFKTEDGTSISFSIATVITKVSSLVADWKRVIEKDLVLFLIENIHDLKISDTIHIAGAVYADRSEANIDLITGYFSLLFEEGKIEEVDGFIRICKK